MARDMADLDDRFWQAFNEGIELLNSWSRTDPLLDPILRAYHTPEEGTDGQ